MEFAKKKWSEGTWFQNVQKLANVLNCNIDDDVYQKFGITLNEEQLETLVVNLTSANNAGKKRKEELRELQNRPDIAEKLWDYEKHKQFVADTIQMVTPLIDKEKLLDSEKNQIVQAATILMYFFMPNIRCLYWSITTNHLTPNYLVEQSDPIVGKMPMYFNFHQHKGTKKTGKAIVHVVDYNKVPDLYNILKKLISMSEEIHSDYLFFDYDEMKPFGIEQFRQFVLDCHKGEMGTYLLRVAQINKREYGNVQSLAEQHYEAAQRGHTQLEDQRYIVA